MNSDKCCRYYPLIFLDIQMPEKTGILLIFNLLFKQFILIKLLSIRLSNY